MRGSSLNSSHSYSIRVEASNSDIGFNSSCSDTSETAAVPSNRTSYSTTFTLYGCDTSGGTVTATLRRSSRFSTVTVDTDSQFVSVTVPPPPPPDPEIDISGLVNSMTEGDDDSFTARGSSLNSSHSYSIRVEASNSDIGFNSSCSDTSETAAVPSNRTSYSTTFTLYGCDTSGGTVTATLRRSSRFSTVTVDTDSQFVSVTAPPTAPAPTGLTVTSSDRYSVSLSWSSVSDAYRYKLERREGTSGSWSTVSSGISGTSKTATGLDCNTTYYFKVSARGDGSPYSTTFGTPSTTDVSSQTDACLPVFQFSPSPLALGGASNVWTVPAEVTSVYVDVSFSSGYVKDTGAGDIEINRVDSSDTVLSTLEVDNENDSGTLTDAAAGSLIRIDVENDAFDTSYALVTLTFHSGSDDTGPELARATVQKESRPYSPTAPSTGTSWSVDDAAGSVTLSWGPGAARLGSNPDHYEVVVRDTSNPSTPLYSNLNVDDSANPATLIISGARTLGLEGAHTAEVRHCNTAGGCSLPFSITFTLAPLPDVSAPTGLSADSSTDTAITLSWNSVTGATGYRLERRTSSTRPIADPWIEISSTISSTSHTATGLAGGTNYDFQVSAYGNGKTYAADWGPWSTPFETSTLPSPAISISGIDTSLGDPATEDSSDSFTVTASNLTASSTYSITVSTDNDKAAFDSACSERSKSVTFTASSASATQSVTIATRTLPASNVCDDGTVVSDHTSSPGLVSDCEAILRAITTLKGAANTALNWSSTRVLSDWDGVTVDGVASRVIRLELSGRGLTGSIPAGLLDGLVKLQTLDLSNNQLQNNPSPSDVSIPSNINRSYMVTLDLSNNQLSGDIPSSLGLYTNLVTLDLSDNDFIGSIPSELGDLDSLTTLDLSENDLSGEIPSELGDLPALVNLSLTGNSFTGCVPGGVWHLANSDSRSIGLSICRPDLPEASGTWNCSLVFRADPSDQDDNTTTMWTDDGVYHALRSAMYKFGPLPAIGSQGFCGFGVIANVSTQPVTTTLTGAVYHAYATRVLESLDSTPLIGVPCPNEPSCMWQSERLFLRTGFGNRMYVYGNHEITSGGQSVVVRTSGGVFLDIPTGPFEQPSPHPPAGVTATVSSQNTVNLSWTVESGVDNYRVERSPNGTDSWTELSSEITSVPYTASAPDCETTYHFRVRAYGDGTTYRASWGPLSGPISATTTACPPGE